ncbi:hypothetical protein NW754_008695 [Fusarium falciforme]|uniref:NAD(P)-binding domain-containing protein n=1 Tax=Fusarium falciforme TaxID=195108 RepID=A0A9W8V315_9HYPO|nr:hypothetical protein NW754_008695 [Fusarium falciforme]KAJ4193602.1 hypothetical protein NW755_003596 [Fusarium falciforme]
MTTSKPLRIAVIGPAGFGGSYLCAELISRGHHVVGLSRNPEKLGSHANYEPRPVDIDNNTDSQLAEAMRDVDVVVSEYGPHTAGHQALQYVPFIEAVRKIILAVKKAKVGYFVMVGGAGSLHIAHEDDLCVADSKDFFLAYRRAIADSHAHVSYMEDRLGPMGGGLRRYRNARLVLRNSDASDDEIKAAKATVDEYEEGVKQDRASDFIKAARASYMFFDGNTSFNWTFVSPSPLYRPGKRTGSYEVTIHNLPLKGKPKGENRLDGRLTGISAADLAIAITDEVESQKHKYQHWTATADLSDDTPAPSYLRLE